MIQKLSKSLLVITLCFLCCGMQGAAVTGPGMDALGQALEQGDVPTFGKLVAQGALRDKPAALALINEYKKNWSAIDRYFNQPGIAGNAVNTATREQWNSLLAAIRAGSMDFVEEMVPRLIGPEAVTRGKNKRRVASIPAYLIGRAQEMEVAFAKLPAFAAAPVAPVPLPAPALLFFRPGQPGFYLTNFYSGKEGETPELSGHPGLDLVIDRRPWPTTEHYYQAQKFPARPDIQEAIRNAPSPEAAVAIARQYEPPHTSLLREDWKDVNVGIMKKALQEKFRQNPNLQRVLFFTGTRELVEASPHDKFWGDPSRAPERGSANYAKGQNMLGKLLMELREQLRQEARPVAASVTPPTRPVTSGPVMSPMEFTSVLVELKDAIRHGEIEKFALLVWNKIPLNRYQVVDRILQEERANFEREGSRDLLDKVKRMQKNFDQQRADKLSDGIVAGNVNQVREALANGAQVTDDQMRVAHIKLPTRKYEQIIQLLS
jgi:ribA/ribD-fused uncharacterized protein